MNVIHENVLVLVDVQETGPKTENGIIMPDEQVEVVRQGSVIRHGEAVPDDVQLKLASKPTVQYKEFYDGSEIIIEGVTYIVMNYKDILIIL